MATPLDPIFVELESRKTAEGYSDFDTQDLSRWAGNDIKSQLEFFSLLALEIALRFDRKEIDFAFADSIIGTVWAMTLERMSQEPPRHVFEIHDAFDAGEGIRLDEPDVDPVLKYTKPAIERYLHSLSKGS